MTPKESGDMQALTQGGDAVLQMTASKMVINLLMAQQSTPLVDNRSITSYNTSRRNYVSNDEPIKKLKLLKLMRKFGICLILSVRLVPL
jgi:hypothetical protein